MGCGRIGILPPRYLFSLELLPDFSKDGEDAKSQYITWNHRVSYDDSAPPTPPACEFKFLLVRAALDVGRNWTRNYNHRRMLGNVSGESKTLLFGCVSLLGEHIGDEDEEC